jgi:hypothetical protein
MNSILKKLTGQRNGWPDSELKRLAEAIRQRNLADEAIATIIGRPPEKGHIGEFIASRLLDIELEHSATNKGFDGRFRSGPLRGRSVNIKMYGKQEGLLDINVKSLPDYYLVLAGPRAPAATSRGGQRPIVIESVYLFETKPLMAELQKRGVTIGTATSVIRTLWDAAEVYPKERNKLLRLGGIERQALHMLCEP